jgi:hypothetical protein
MLSQIFTDPSVPVTSPVTLCGVYDGMAETMQLKASGIMAKGELPLKFDEMCGMPNGRVYILEPAADFPFLFAAMKLRGLIVVQKEAAQHVFKMVRDAAKGSLAVDAYKRLQKFVTQKSMEDAPFSEDVYSELRVLLGRD